MRFLLHRDLSLPSPGFPLSICGFALVLPVFAFFPVHCCVRSVTELWGQGTLLCGTLGLLLLKKSFPSVCDELLRASLPFYQLLPLRKAFPSPLFKAKILGMLLDTCGCLCAVSVVWLSHGCVSQDVIHLLPCYPENPIFLPMLEYCWLS